ncbi:hypothetical protein [Hwanghaeella sp.]|uniref:hypothetical protein n=1 Tax=Hwanghaeella sp. TaxID=2605943 RepID=UPI003CCBF823
MKKLAVLAAAGAILVGFAGTAGATAVSLAGLNTGFTGHSSLTDSWFYNFNGVRSPADNPGDRYGNRHLPTNGPTPNSGYDVKSSSPNNDLVFGEALRSNGNFVSGLGLTVTGAVDFGSSITSPVRIIEDIWNDSNRHHHGIGVYPHSESTSEEQVNAGLGFNQFLILDFNQTVSLAGFDFAGGDHHACDSSSNNCGGWELYDFSSGVLGSVLQAGALNDKDFEVFEPIIGQTFALRSVMGQGVGESGWYLSGVAGAVAPVPLPLPFVMLATALAAFGLLRRKQTGSAV